MNILNKLRKMDKIQSLLNIVSIFLNKCNKFSNAGAGMLDFTYPMTLEELGNPFLWIKKLRFCHIYVM